MCVGMFVLSCFSRVRVCLALWTVARQASLSMGFSRQYWSGWPCPRSGNLPDPGAESNPHLIHLVHQQAGSLPLAPPGKPTA